MVLVVALLGVLLCLEEALPDLDQECVAVPEHDVCILRLSRPLLVGQKERWWAAVDNLEWSHAKCHVVRRVVAVFCPR